MRYKGKVYRPPSEAYSLIVQVTYGRTLSWRGGYTAGWSVSFWRMGTH